MSMTKVRAAKSYVFPSFLQDKMKRNSLMSDLDEPVEIGSLMDLYNDVVAGKVSLDYEGGLDKLKQDAEEQLRKQRG